ncbi:MAG: hemerythrin domain-containing protein [Acidihalobacter sp.]|jgi:hemerythrin-like domain-containing protein
MTKNALDEVREDHRNMALLLELLRRDVDALREGADEALDIQRVADIVDYFAHYPDRVHHPREETMFTVFREHHEASPELSDALERVQAQHVRFPELTTTLNESLEAAMHDVPVPREELVARLDDYIAQQLEHLDLEEGLVFPELGEKMTAKEWREVARRGPQERDPVFGSEVREAYVNLYQRLESFIA